MTALDIFTYSGQQVRTVLVDGEPWFFAGDVARILGYRDTHNLTRRLDDDDKGTHSVSTPGGTQSLITISEAGMFDAILRSDIEGARKFKRWLTHEVLPEIRRTGSYSAAPEIDLTSPTGILALAEKFTETARALVAVTARAEVAEQFKEAIELNDGITPRDFHKKYLPGVTETEFNAALYRHRLLIDQTGQRGRNAKGKIINGKQHRHPTYQGKAFFYLHSELDRDKIRRENVRVIPGAPELLLVKWCTARGLTNDSRSIRDAVEASVQGNDRSYDGSENLAGFLDTTEGVARVASFEPGIGYV